MAEFLIRIRDKEGHNPGLLGEREVVVVCEDGWPWSVLERTSPDWRIVKVPGMSLDEGDQFIVPEPVDETRFVRRRRAFKIDVQLLPPSVRAYMANDQRSQPFVEVPKGVFIASKVARAPLLRDDVFAQDDFRRNN